MSKIHALFLICVLSSAHAFANVITIGDQRVKSVNSMSLGPNRACVTSEAGPVCWGKRFDEGLPKDFGSIAKIAVGGEHFCVLSLTGSLSCFGSNTYNESTVPEGLAEVTDVKAQVSNTCALSQGKLKCWGSDYFNQNKVPENLKTIKQFELSGSHVCVIETDGTSNAVKCWGDNGNGQSNVPLGLVNPTYITLGNDHTCALDNNKVVCWGFKADDLMNIPQEVADKKIKKISTGLYHVCALFEDKTVSCWGFSWSLTPPPAQTVPEGLSEVSDINSSTDYNCASTPKGLECWGESNYGTTKLPLDFRTAASIDAGGYFACGLFSSGEVGCFGSDKSSVISSMVDYKYTQVSLGLYHMCGVTLENDVRCWGDSGEWPDNNKTIVPNSFNKAYSLVAGDNNTCATTDNGVVCWGSNSSGQSDVPQSLTDVTQLAAGRSHVCALTTADSIVCWGNDVYGQTVVPAEVTDTSMLAAGGFVTCALSKEGRVRCWGDNDYGQTAVPSDLGPVTKISVGGAHVCALTSQGQVRCWGRNVYEQCNVPENLKNPRDVSAGYAHSCALTDEGVVCWGLISN